MILSTIDRLFIGVNHEIVANDENPDRELCRFEFFELLLRISICKFKDTYICDTYHESFEKLIKEYVFRHSHKNQQSWQEFRENYLWTIEVNDLIEANLEGLRKVYE